MKYKAMPIEIWEALDKQGGKIPNEYAQAGWHYCSAWENLLIGPGMLEWNGCACNLKRCKNCED